MKIKTSYVHFFEDSFNRRAVTPILELNEGNISTLAMFQYERGSSKIKQVFGEKKHDFQFLFYKVRQLSFFSLFCGLFSEKVLKKGPFGLFGIQFFF